MPEVPNDEPQQPKEAKAPAQTLAEVRAWSVRQVLAEFLKCLHEDEVDRANPQVWVVNEWQSFDGVRAWGADMVIFINSKSKAHYMLDHAGLKMKFELTSRASHIGLIDRSGRDEIITKAREEPDPADPRLAQKTEIPPKGI